MKKTITIIIMAVMIFGLGGYICYDKFYTKEETKGKEETTEKTEVKDITTSELALKLEKSLISLEPDKGNVYGLYFDEDVTIDNIDAKEILPYVLINYAKDKGIKFVNNIHYDNNVYTYYDSEDEVATLSEVEKYAKTLFGKEISFDMTNITMVSLYGGTTAVYYVDGAFHFGYRSSSGAGYSLVNKLQKAEQKGDYIYIYDTATFCANGSGGADCSRAVDTDYTQYIVTCSVYEEDENSCSKLIGSEFESSSIQKKLANYTLENLSDKLNNYKHTFKKYNDGNYYWISSEIVK